MPCVRLNLGYYSSWMGTSPDASRTLDTEGEIATKDAGAAKIAILGIPKELESAPFFRARTFSYRGQTAQTGPNPRSPAYQKSPYQSSTKGPF